MSAILVKAAFVSLIRSVCSFHFATVEAQRFLTSTDLVSAKGKTKVS